MTKNMMLGLGLLFVDQLRTLYGEYMENKCMLPQEDWFDELLRQSLVSKDVKEDDIRNELQRIERQMVRYLLAWFDVLKEEGFSETEARAYIQKTCKESFAEEKTLFSKFEEQLGEDVN